MSRRKSILSWMSLFFAVSVLSWAGEPIDPAASKAKCVESDWEGIPSVQGEVVTAIDGDTVKLAVGPRVYNVRFLSIDTPETHFQGMSQGHWGEVAAARLAELLPAGSQVQVEFGIQKCDKFGRILGTVFKKGLNINRQMLLEALAVNYCIWPNIDCEEYARITDHNIEERKGIFGDASLELPYEWRRIVSQKPHEKFVGNLLSHEVYRPGSLDRVSVGQRVFFMEEADIQKPFILIEE